MSINNNPSENDEISENNAVNIPDPSPKVNKSPSDKATKKDKESK